MGMRRLNIVRTFFYFFLRWISNTKFTRHNAAVMAIFMQIFSAYFFVFSQTPWNATSWVEENCVQIFIGMNFLKREFIMTSLHIGVATMQTWKFKFQMIAKIFNIISLKRKKFPTIAIINLIHKLRASMRQGRFVSHPSNVDAATTTFLCSLAMHCK